MDKHIYDLEDSGSDSYRKHSLRFYSQMSAEFGRQNKEWMVQNQNSDHFAKDFHERLQAQEKLFAAHKQMDVNVIGAALNRYWPTADYEVRMWLHRDIQHEGNLFAQLRAGAEQTSGSQRHMLLAISAGHEARMVEMAQEYERRRDDEESCLSDPDEAKNFAGEYPANDLFKAQSGGMPAELRIQGLADARLANLSIDEARDREVLKFIYENLNEISVCQDDYAAANLVETVDRFGKIRAEVDLTDVMPDAVSREIFDTLDEIYGKDKNPLLECIEAHNLRQVEEAKAGGQDSAERPQWSQIRGAQMKEWLKGREQDSEQSKDMSQSGSSAVNAQAFREACERGDINEAQKLLDAGVDINGIYTRTPLFLASERGEIKVVQFLLNHGASIHAGDNGNTLLHAAVRCGHADVASLLIERGISVNAKNDDGQTPLFTAAFMGDENMAKLLVERGADVNVNDRGLHTPLHWVAEKGNTTKGNTEIAKLLIRHGADLSAKNDDGNTPLHRSVANGHTDIAKLFIKNGADVRAKNFDEMTPLQYQAGIAAQAMVEADQLHEHAVKSRALNRIAREWNDEHQAKRGIEYDI